MVNDMMTREEINEALSSRKMVVLEREPTSQVLRNLFGELVVVSVLIGVPTRYATEDDVRRATLYKKY